MMRAAFLILMLLTTACLEERGPATAIDVSVKSDLSADELSEIQYSVFSLDAASEAIASQTAKGAALKQTFVVEQRRQRALRLVIEGRGAKGKVRYEALARFVPQRTVALQVFLGRTCLAKSCAEGQTCVARGQDGGEPGTCVAVPMRDELAPVLKPGDEHAWDIPSGQPTGSVPMPPAPGDATCERVPGLACDPVRDCGCSADQHCQMRSGVPTCAAAGTKPANAPCRADAECKDALACGLSRTCAAQCVADDDCSGGTCAKAPGRTFGTCLQLCTADRGSCPAGLPCSPYMSGDVTRSVCLAPLTVCPFRSDDRCDEPLFGSGLCARGTDPEDCACDPVRQTGCPSTQSCNLRTESNGAATNKCEPYGQSPLGGRCEDAVDCARGLTCISGTCLRYCRNDADCPNNVYCMGVVTGEFDVMIGVCTLECTPDAMPPTCLAGAHCEQDVNSKLGGSCWSDP